MTTDGDATIAALPAGAYCPRCDYDLRGATSDRCPECGHALRRLRDAPPVVPWMQRATRGRALAFWQTVAAATFTPGRFAYAIMRPLPYNDAFRFRRLANIHATVLLLIVAGLVAFAFYPRASNCLGEFHWPAVIAELIGVALLPWALTSVPRPLFQSPRLNPLRRARAVALSCYASSGLVVLSVAMLIAVWTAGVRMKDGGLKALPQIPYGPVSIVVLVLFWLPSLIMTVRQSLVRQRLWVDLLVLITFAIAAGVFVIGGGVGLVVDVTQPSDILPGIGILTGVIGILIVLHTVAIRRSAETHLGWLAGLFVSSVALLYAPLRWSHVTVDLIIGCTLPIAGLLLLPTCYLLLARRALGPGSWRLLAFAVLVLLGWATSVALLLVLLPAALLYAYLAVASTFGIL